jgi:glyceraldehyde 3-phosphate dehydrogenase
MRETMAIKVAINGFGRMGKLAFRAGWRHDEYRIAHINEINGDAACHAHLLEFDSVHGHWKHDIASKENKLLVDGRKIRFTSEVNPADVDWKKKDIDIVIDCTGKHKTVESLKPYFDQGIRKVIVSAPCPAPARNIVYGVNHDTYNAETDSIITAASCTTNCLAPVVKVIKEQLGIVHASMTTIHNITNTQTIVDKGHKDLRRARACGISLIPTSTGSAKAITQIFPDLEGKINGIAVRVPLTNASITDCVFEVERPTTASEVNQLMQDAADKELKGILGYEERPLVSIDYQGDPRSSIIDADSTMVIDGTQVKLLAWYDNEWGYVNRMMNITQMVAESISPRDDKPRRR